MSKKSFKSHRPLFSSPAHAAAKNAKIKWRVLPIIWMALKRMATVLGFVLIINMVVMLLVLPAVLSGGGTAAISLPDDMVLYVEFEDGFAEMAEPGGFMDPFAPPPMTVREIVDTINAAADDDRVSGMVARMRSGQFGLTHVYEVRTALAKFRAAGKFAHIYSSSFGEGNGLGRYYLASAFDEIWMQPLGIVTISGISADIPFMRGTLDKLGVRPQFYQRKDYKTAYESLTSKGISKYNKEATESLIADIRDELLSTIPAERGMDAKAFSNLVDKGLFTAQEAQAAGLITTADYGDVLLDNIAEELTGARDIEGLEFVDLDDYAAIRTAKAEKARGAKVALIYVTGAIMPDENGGGLSGGQVAAASEIAPAILRASKDDDVEAIVLRVDSPGGSPSASESILRAVERAQARGKIVVVSMGSMAASGGYWVSAYADRIFVLPTTLTGSIGVVGGKFSIAELSEKIGVNWDSVSWGKNAGMWSMNTPFNASEAERINAMMDQVYDSFLERVSKGRGMDIAAVDKLAGGRVWTGMRAVEHGLADEIGGLNDALDYVAEAVGADDRAALSVEILPKPKTALELIVEMLEGQVSMGKAVKAQAEVMEMFAPALDAVNVRARQPVSTYETLRLD
jgi:protease-4